MKLFRRLGFAFLLAFALVAGQQAAALHELGHATGELAPKHGTNGKTGCDSHYLYSQLGSSANAAKSVAPIVAYASADPALRLACRVARRAVRLQPESSSTLL